MRLFATCAFAITATAILITVPGFQAAPVLVAQSSAQQYTGDVLEARGPGRFFGQTLEELQHGGIRSYSIVSADGSLPLPPILRDSKSLQRSPQSELRGTRLFSDEIPHQSAKMREGSALSTSSSPWPQDLPFASELRSSHSNAREPAQVAGLDGVGHNGESLDQMPRLSGTDEASVAEALLSMLKQPTRKQKNIASSSLGTEASSNTEELLRIGKSMVDSRETRAITPRASKANPSNASNLAVRKRGRPRIYETEEDSRKARLRQSSVWLKDQLARNTPFALEKRKKAREYARKRTAKLRSTDEVGTSNKN